MNPNVLFAIFRRNFISYFSNPTGYVFICVFVVLSSLAAFFPPEFFNAGLANLDQLNTLMPFIMLVFLPAITMSIWSDEQRQGTDELLLTIPANDIDVVLGKYLGAVAIFGVSLMFSLVSNYLVLFSLGDPDFLLFLATYFGYFMMGIAMLAIGMVASFLTRNLTIAFVLGAIFNAPLVMFQVADSFLAFFTFLPSSMTRDVKSWSLSAQFADFGRGVISISSIAYFSMIVVVMLYLSMLLIGRRHWLGGRDGHAMIGHYLARALALAVIAVGVTLFFENHDFIRADMTSDSLNSVSPQTEQLLATLREKPREELKKERERIESKRKKFADKEDEASKAELKKLDKKLKALERQEKQLDRQIRIEAFISPSSRVPEAYVQTRLKLISMLNELQKRGKKIDVKIYETDLFTDMAKRAKQLYGILPRSVERKSRGVQSTEDIFLGVAIRRGTEKPVVVPFFDLGLPVEYELIRSVSTVAHIHRKTLGIVTTDAQLIVRGHPIVAELRKQFNVVAVDPSSRIADADDAEEKAHDLLMIVQPSSLTPPQLDNLLGAIRGGVPMLIFEDPLPVAINVPGTDVPKPPPPPRNEQERMMRQFGQMPPGEAKCDIKKLFDLLGVRMVKTVKRAAETPTYNEEGEQTARDARAVFRSYDTDNSRGISEDEFLKGLDEERQDIARRRFAAMDRPRGSRLPPDRRLTFDEFAETAVIWQQDDPYPKLKRYINKSNEWVFVREDAPGADGAFNADDPLSKGMQELLFVFPGAIEEVESKSRTFTALVTTGDETGVIRINDIPRQNSLEDIYELQAQEMSTRGTKYTMAARITGTIDGVGLLSKKKPDAKQPADDVRDKSKLHELGKINVVMISDVDMLAEFVVALRARPIPDLSLRWQNVPFILNTLDDLAGDDRFIDIRKRELEYRTLSKVRRQTSLAVTETERVRDKFIREQKAEERKIDDQFELEGERFRKKQDEVRDRSIRAAKEMYAELIKLGNTVQDLEAKRDRVRERNRNARNEKIKQIEDDLEETIREIQDGRKFWAVVLPPIPPLMLALVVFFVRRTREQEGVARERLK
jgi:ABC-type transport system involved in multi-copper enzyme maturation permease subunit/ABC-type uncharacterized transport system involved in gliding motility auxiliary subunit